MKALCWQGKKDLRCEEVPDPIIEAPRDAIVEVTSCAICGADLHLWDGLVPTMCKGDVMGHEMMGRIVDVGSDAKRAGAGLKVGDRVVMVESRPLSKNKRFVVTRVVNRDDTA